MSQRSHQAHDILRAFCQPPDWRLVMRSVLLAATFVVSYLVGGQVTIIAGLQIFAYTAAMLWRSDHSASGLSVHFAVICLPCAILSAAVLLTYRWRRMPFSHASAAILGLMLSAIVVYARTVAWLPQ